MEVRICFLKEISVLDKDYNVQEKICMWVFPKTESVISEKTRLQKILVRFLKEKPSSDAGVL